MFRWRVLQQHWAGRLVGLRVMGFWRGFMRQLGVCQLQHMRKLYFGSFEPGLGLSAVRMVRLRRPMQNVLGDLLGLGYCVPILPVASFATTSATVVAAQLLKPVLRRPRRQDVRRCAELQDLQRVICSTIQLRLHWMLPCHPSTSLAAGCSARASASVAFTWSALAATTSALGSLPPIVASTDATGDTTCASRPQARRGHHRLWRGVPGAGHNGGGVVRLSLPFRAAHHGAASKRGGRSQRADRLRAAKRPISGDGEVGQALSRSLAQWYSATTA